jgi:hypothetical protein
VHDHAVSRSSPGPATVCPLTARVAAIRALAGTAAPARGLAAASRTCNQGALIASTADCPTRNPLSTLPAGAATGRLGTGSSHVRLALEWVPGARGGGSAPQTRPPLASLTSEPGKPRQGHTKAGWMGDFGPLLPRHRVVGRSLRG